MNSNLKLQSRERLRVALDTQPEIRMEVEWPQVKKKLQERLEKKGLCNSKVQYYHGTALKELRDSSSLSHLLGLHRDALLGDTLELPLYVVPDPTAGSALLDNRAKEIVLQVNQPGGLVQLNLQSDILLGEGGFGKVRQAGDKEPQIDSAAQSSFPSRPQGSYMQKELIVEVMPKKLLFNLHFMNSNLKLQSRERLRVALDTQPEIRMEVEWPQVKKKLQERLEKKGLCNSKVQYYHGTALKELCDSSSLSHLLGLHRDALLGDTLELPLYVVPDPTAGSALLDNRAKEIVLQVNQPGGLVQLNLQSDILLGEGGFGKVRQAGDKEPQIDSAAQSSFPSRPQGSYMQKELIVEVMPKKLLFNLHFMNSNLKLQSRERLRVALDTQPEICMEVEWPQVKKKLQERLEKKGLCNSKVQYYHGTALKELRDSSSLSHLLGLHRDALLGDTLELPLYVVPDPTAGSALLDNRAKEGWNRAEAAQ